jgi:4,5-DOPA dioxygenase extradiol
MLALDARKGADLARWARSLPAKPSAILILSAHWQASPPTLSSTRTGTPLIYDFSGFDEALYRVQHPCPPLPEALATRILTALAPFSPRRSDRGLDHGAWVPLRHLDPEAQIPTAQLSMPRSMSERELVALGRALAPFRDEGVWILGSGNLTHNLGRLDFSDRAPPERWAVEFDRWTEERLRAGDLDGIVHARTRAPAFSIAHPTDEHWRPLLVALGAGEDALDRITFPVTGFEYGNLSRRCVHIG